VKVGVWNAVGTRIAGPAFFNETTVRDMNRSFSGNSFHSYIRRKIPWLV
jgi:hypothetical protein